MTTAAEVEGPADSCEQAASARPATVRKPIRRPTADKESLIVIDTPLEDGAVVPLKYYDWTFIAAPPEARFYVNSLSVEASVGVRLRHLLLCPAAGYTERSSRDGGTQEERFICNRTCLQSLEN